jgi:DNA-binding transcriptional MerR regulator/predicted O-methyltransferase YrrM
VLSLLSYSSDRKAVLYRISEFAEKVGLSRSTVLYYEKIGLIQSQRTISNYRIFNDKDVQRIILLNQLKNSGLNLKECQACLNGKIDKAVLEKRLIQLEKEIQQKQISRDLLTTILGKSSQKKWHQQTQKLAPEAHFEWLMKQGFTEREALHLKWLSKDMNEHERYMNDFMLVFQNLERWGPGSQNDTLKALSKIPHSPETVLEIGCGKGISSLILAEHTDAILTVIDNDPPAIAALKQITDQQNLSARLQPICASMTDLPFEGQQFEVIWAEASAYIMGVEKALTVWQKFLQPQGFMVISDLVWLNESPSKECQAFWQNEYPDMQTVAKRCQQMQQAGFEILHHFDLSQTSWDNYIHPLKHRLNELKTELQDSVVLKDLNSELSIYDNYLGEFGYEFFILQKR